MQAVSTLNLRSARRGWGSGYLFLEHGEAAAHVPRPASPGTQHTACRRGQRALPRPAWAHHQLEIPASAPLLTAQPSPSSPWHCFLASASTTQTQRCGLEAAPRCCCCCFPWFAPSAQLCLPFYARSEPIVSSLSECSRGTGALNMRFSVRVHPLLSVVFSGKGILLLLLSQVKVIVPVVTSTFILPDRGLLI